MSGQWDWKNAATITTNHPPSAVYRKRMAAARSTSPQGQIAALTARVAELEAALRQIAGETHQDNRNEHSGKTRSEIIDIARAVLAKGAA